MKPLADKAWDAWSPSMLADRLRGEPAGWCVVGGWALDLWHGTQTREHEDLEFAVLRDDIGRFRLRLQDLEFFAAKDGTLTHVARSTSPPADVAQLWGADLGQGRWRVDMMVDCGTPDIWVCKRDPAIRMPRPLAIRRSDTSIPYLAPAITLLFKAKYRREKDERDFAMALPKLSATERADLGAWLERVHPGHEWIRLL